MEQGRRFSKQLFTYKSKEARGRVIQVSPRNWSKQCSEYGNVKDNLRLIGRTYSCACCGISIVRDLNLAINISFRALS